MKFKSRKSIFTLCVSYGSAVLLLLVCCTVYNDKGFSLGAIALYAVSVLFIWMMLSMAHNTVYEIKQDTVYYRSGFVRGAIKIDRIREIIKGKTMYAGLKPATAANGLIIKYDKFEEIYFSPATNDSFIDALLKLKKDIIITK